AQRSASPSCTAGMVSVPGPPGTCCWPGQRWSAQRRRCTGAPSCPQGFLGQGPTCVAAPPPACEGGRVAVEGTGAHCCWPGQQWSDAAGRCLGVPQCPYGLV